MGTLAMGDVVNRYKKVFVSTSPLPLCEEKQEIIIVEVHSFIRARSALRESMIKVLTTLNFRLFR